MTDEVRTEVGVRAVPMVENPTAIRVLAIKAKLVEQMHESEVIPEGCKVVGFTHCWVVVQLESGRLVKVHQMNWVKFTALEGTYAYQNAAANAMNKLPQLFQD